jgi:acetyl/propionyl-CoA carboxylase alpha subunit
MNSPLAPGASRRVRYHVTVGDLTFEVEINAEGVWIDGDRIEACAPEPVNLDLYSFLVDGASHTVLAGRVGPGGWDLQLRGRRYRVDVVDERTKAMRDMSPAGSTVSGPAAVRAPMPGLVVKVEVEEGELVEAGGGLLVVEAMKMENSLTAPVGGRVGAIHVVAGQTLEKDELLMDMLPTDRASESEGD